MRQRDDSRRNKKRFPKSPGGIAKQGEADCFAADVAPTCEWGLEGVGRLLELLDEPWG